MSDPVGPAAGGIVGDGLDARLLVRRSDGFALDVDLRVDAGRTMALLGPNGAGKSTAVAALAGLVPLDGGRITLGGRVLDDVDGGVAVPPEHRRIGLVFQDHVLFPNLSALDNIAFGPRSQGASRRAASAAAAGWLVRMGLDGLGDRRPGQLSGGQAQRVALARALAAEPDLLLLDEPLGALDVSTHSRLRRVLADHLADFAGPRVLITHDPADAFVLADVIQVVEDGQVTQVGRPDEIRGRPATQYVADLAGVNLLAGRCLDGTITLDGGGPELHTADTAARGPVLVAISPRAVALYPDEPHGSPRNCFAATVGGIERLGDTVRAQLDQPIALTADITPGAADELGLRPGSTTWVSIKATEVEVTPA